MCGGSSSGPCKPADSPIITLAAYSNPYDAYGKLTSTFASDWKDKHDGQSLIFQMSFGGSTTQAENIVNDAGFAVPPHDEFESVSTCTVPEDVQLARLRDPNTKFVSYVPPGTLARGKLLVETGDNKKTVACGTCHGPGLVGLKEIAAEFERFLAEQQGHGDLPDS